MLRAHAYYWKRNYDKALADYKEWLRLISLHPEPSRDYTANYCNDMAWSLATNREAPGRFGEAAVGLAEGACRMTEWKNWMYLDTLAAAYADAGQFNQAVQWQTKALKLAPKNVPTIQEVMARLQLYQAKKPYRQPVR